jgi:light-regulated signal transduction histidine kinase (bacteriophytochrome)
MLEEELEATNREVMMLTLELEQRVADRTAQLSAANLELRREIAERLRGEQEIIALNKDLDERARQLTAANEELEAFSSSVSHDLRSPLTRVISYAALLKETAGPKVTEKEQSYIDKMCSAGRQMVTLIDDLLRLSHASKADLSHTSVELNGLVDSIVQDLQEEMRGREILWKRPHLPVVSADRALLRQVFVNLISNALKYTRPRNPAEIEIAACGTPEEWTFCVRDNGVGFSPENVAKLFGAFQRLHTRDEFEGTGIGLANVRRIIQRHGGRVWADARPGAGAVFFFTLPMVA